MSHRVIVLDTETTGISWENGHRIIEIGGVEMVNRRPTGNNFHVFIDPQREVDEEAAEVHGWDRENLIIASEGKVFADVAKDVVEFLRGAELVIHNAPFDMGHLDAEFRRLGWPELSGQVTVTDTLVKANNMYPGRRNNLDALASRLGVDTSNRTLHGALLDAEILADVYLLMTTRQNDFKLDNDANSQVDLAGIKRKGIHYTEIPIEVANKLPVVEPLSSEMESHIAMMKKIESDSEEQDLAF